MSTAGVDTELAAHPDGGAGGPDNDGTSQPATAEVCREGQWFLSAEENVTAAVVKEDYCERGGRQTRYPSTR